MNKNCHFLWQPVSSPGYIKITTCSFVKSAVLHWLIPAGFFLFFIFFFFFHKAYFWCLLRFYYDSSRNLFTWTFKFYFNFLNYTINCIFYCILSHWIVAEPQDLSLSFWVWTYELLRFINDHLPSSKVYRLTTPDVFMTHGIQDLGLIWHPYNCPQGRP